MSTLKEFTDRVVERINDKMKESDIYASLQIVPKNNGMEKVGIAIHKKGCNVAAVVHTEGFLLAYEGGVPIDEIAEKVLCISQESKQENINLSQITDYENVKSRLALKLINRKENRKLLNDMPHINVCDDLACICYIVLEQPENGKIMVHNGLFEKWNVPVMDMMHTAMENTKRMYPAKVMDFEKVVKKSGMFSEADQLGGSMYIITHGGEIYGAVAALYNGLLDRLAEEIGSDLILIPSSVHEFLMMPKKMCHIGVEELNQMIREVNAEQLEPDEVLSDHAYLYCKETKEIYSLTA